MGMATLTSLLSLLIVHTGELVHTRGFCVSLNRRLRFEFDDLVELMHQRLALVRGYPAWEVDLGFGTFCNIGAIAVNGVSTAGVCVCVRT